MRSIEDVDLIVDADAHVTETFESLLPYIDNKAVRRMVERTSTPEDSILSATRPSPVEGSLYHGSQDKDTSHADSGTVSADRKLMEMGDFDIDYGVVSPTLFAALETTNNPRVAVSIANAWNEWVQNEFLDEHDEIKSGILIAGKKPEKAVQEIDAYATEDGFVGVIMAPGGLLPPHGDEKYSAIYQAAEEHNLPIMIHGTGLATQWNFPEVYRYSETYAEQHVVSHPFMIMWSLSQLVLRGVLEQHPHLDFVFQECGIGWVPYLKWRLDDVYMEWSDQLPHLDTPPSELIENQCYFTTQPIERAPQPKQLATLVELVGPDSIMYSADLPHPTFDPPEELFNPIRSHFDAETVNDIMGGNAARVFGI